jgi:hypothetical protein
MVAGDRYCPQCLYGLRDTDVFAPCTIADEYVCVHCCNHCLDGEIHACIAADAAHGGNPEYQSNNARRTRLARWRINTAKHFDRYKKRAGLRWPLGGLWLTWAALTAPRYPVHDLGNDDRG